MPVSPSGDRDDVPAVHPAHAPGDVVDGKYQLLELLGIGGMGTVWRARDRVLEVEVALKLVRPRDAAPGALARLLREARAAVSIPHPSIVRVLSFGMSGPEAYIVLELLEGESLEDRLYREEALEPADALKLALAIARALQAVHAAGVVHRDVKPGNIFLARTGDGAAAPKLLDFGIARSGKAQPQRLTVPGQVLGTPYYMAPEQASGRDEVDHRADIWGLCAVIYEAIAGVPPFNGDNYNAVISAVLMDPLVPLSQVAAVSEDVCALVHRGLQKRPADRFASASELAAAIENCLARLESAASQPTLCATEIAELDTLRPPPTLPLPYDAAPTLASARRRRPPAGHAALAALALASLVGCAIAVAPTSAAPVASSLSRAAGNMVPSQNAAALALRRLSVAVHTPLGASADADVMAVDTDGARRCVPPPPVSSTSAPPERLSASDGLPLPLTPHF